MVEYTYDSWGKPISVTGTLATTLGANQPFRYRGYVYDTDTGMYYLQSRYYNPNICRFISADVLLSTGQGVIGHNSFAYCLNNPINYMDTEGTKPKGNSHQSYSSLFEALKAAAKILNRRTANTNKEYGLIVYFSNDKYYLSEVIGGYHDGIFFGRSIERLRKEGKILAAAIHSHPSCYAHDNENPSKTDNGFFLKYGIDLYLITPNGFLKKCDRNSKDGVLIYKNPIVDMIMPKNCLLRPTHYIGGRLLNVAFITYTIR